ncbi:hypothetical protein PSHT_07553 [Puccinia striiformis]|uniref:BAH domain-containing protein n=1 Tax=Puccinia striiformis TaxID=27350 RepID=A0A2S4VWQ6_9BASI|nr:hypothetical protein PSHT_07553 [Puccinia striiformis]
MTAKDRIPDPESGWMRDGNSHLNSQALANFIITRLKHERLPANNFSSHSIIPHQGALSDTTIAQDSPALNLYQAFIDAEKAYSDNPERLAGIYVLKRLYQELTQGDARDKILLEGLNHKGDHIKIGDWFISSTLMTHLGRSLHNLPTLSKGRYRVVGQLAFCWYYRPEETVHYMSRTFLENEVFKTGNFIDHVVESDIMGRCLVLFYTKYGRLPTHPPRRPHGTEPGEESNQPTRSPSILSKSLSLPHPASSSVTPTVSPNLPFPSTSTATNTANSKTFDLTSLELCHLLGHSKNGPLKRPPCLLDLVASQDCFEKLPEKLFDLGESMTEVTGELNEKQDEENNGQSKAGGQVGEVEDLVWFPCLPSSSFLTSKNQHHLHHHLNNQQAHGNNKKNDQHRDPSLLSANKSVHSQAYLDWISKK